MNQTSLPPKGEERIIFLDYLRTFATLMVIYVHSCEFFYIDGDGVGIGSEGDRFWVSLIDSALRSCVPLFAMMSGYLLLPLKEEQSVSKFYRRRFERVFIPFAIWLIFYATLPALWGAIDGLTVQKNLSYLLFNFNGNNGHLWFVYMLLGLYLFMPIFSPWLSKVSKRGEQAFLLVWFFTTFHHWGKAYIPVLLGDFYQPTMLGNTYQPTFYGECFWNEFHMFWYFSGYIGYVVLAHYIRTYIKWNTTKSLLIGTSLFLVGYYVTFSEFFGRTFTETSLYNLEISWRFCTFNVALMAAGVFIMFKTINHDKGLLYGIVKDISRLSYGMYLMHIFILNAMYTIFHEHFENPTTIVLVGGSTFLLCYVLTKALSYLPKSKYLVG